MADSEAKLTEVLVLNFHDDMNDKDHRLRIPNPRGSLTGSEVKEAMDLVAETKFIWPNVKPKNAKVVKTVTSNFDITAS